MNEENSKFKSFTEKVPQFVWNILALLAVSLVFSLIRYAGSDPTFWVDKKAVDSGIYLPADQPFYITNTDKENVGNHVLIVGTPKKANRKRKGSYQYAVKNLRTDQFFVLLSEELLPSGQLEIDGMAVGYAKIEDSQNRSRYVPVLRVTGSSRNYDSYLDLAAPVQSVVTPGISVSAEGISLTLDRIEYRGKLARVGFSVENMTESQLRLHSMDIRSGKTIIGGAFFLDQYRPPLEIGKYLSDNSEILPSLILDPGKSDWSLLATSPIQPEDPVEIILEYTPYGEEARENILAGGELAIIELRLIYTPEIAEDAA